MTGKKIQRVCGETVNQLIPNADASATASAVGRAAGIFEKSADCSGLKNSARAPKMKINSETTAQTQVYCASGNPSALSKLILTKSSWNPLRNSFAESGMVLI